MTRPTAEQIEAKSATNRAAHQPRMVVLGSAGEEKFRPKKQSMPISLSLPWPPSINHYYQHTRKGVHIGVDGKNYRRSVDSYCMAWKVTAIEGRIQLVVTCSPPDKRKRDLDNLLKCLLDSLQAGGCFKDDSQIDDLRIVRGAPVKGGRVQVEIRAMDSLHKIMAQSIQLPRD